MAMRTITIEVHDGATTKAVNTVEIGINSHDGGISSRRGDGTWAQWSGNGQTPTFSDPAHLMRYLRNHFYPGQVIRMVRGSARNWS